MRRSGWALPLAAAWVLVCGAAWAAEPSQALSNDVGDHLWLTIIAGFLPPIVKALNEGTLNLPTMPARFRLMLIAALSGLATAIELVKNGASWTNAFAAFAVAAGPSLLIEAVHAKWGGWKGAKITEGPRAGDGGPGPKIITVPPPQRDSLPPLTVKMVSLAIVVGMFLYACGKVCPIVKLASDVCPLIMVELPDGTTEAVPSDQIRGLAMQARASRMGAARDAGSE